MLIIKPSIRGKITRILSHINITLRRNLAKTPKIRQQRVKARMHGPQI